MKTKYKYSRKKICKILNGLVGMVDISNAKVKIKEMLLEPITKDKEECQHENKLLVLGLCGSSTYFCKECNQELKSQDKEVEPIEEVDIEKIVGKSNRFIITRLWEKQCEIIDRLNSLNKGK